MPRARHTSCASIHLSGAGGAIFFCKSLICTASVLTSFLNSWYALVSIIVNSILRFFLSFWICSKVKHILYPFQTDSIRVFRWRALAYLTIKEKSSSLASIRQRNFLLLTCFPCLLQHHIIHIPSVPTRQLVFYLFNFPVITELIGGFINHSVYR